MRSYVRMYVRRYMSSASACLGPTENRWGMTPRGPSTVMQRRMLQAWPPSDTAMRKALAIIEGKYAEEMIACRAVAPGLRVLYPMPEIVRTAATGEERARKAARTASSSSAVLSESGEVRASSDVGNTGDDTRKSILPEEVETSMCNIVPMPTLSSFGPDLWFKVTQQCLLHAHVLHASALGKVQALVSESTEPVVWQARAVKSISPKELILIPFSSVLLPHTEVKRPATLHPALRTTAEVTSGAEGCTDEVRFVLKSPLLGKVGEHAPAPFWYVLKVSSQESANMELVMCTVNMPTPTLALPCLSKSQSAQRTKKANLRVTFPVLVNTKQLERGHVLKVFYAESATSPEEARAGGNGERGQSDA